MIPTLDQQYTSSNILPQEKIIPLLLKLKEQGKKIGLCDGSFDLLHPGHMTHFHSAKKYCDILVVVVASDTFSQSRKGNGRPIFSVQARAYSISQLDVVDYITINKSTDNIRQFIEDISLDYYIRGPDYADEQNIELQKTKKMMSTWGGEIVYTTDEKLSTTDILRYIQQNIKQVI